MKEQMGDMNSKRGKEKGNHGYYIYELQHVKIHFQNTSFYLIFQQSPWMFETSVFKNLFALFDIFVE